jgi:hypothetical protein
MDSPVYLLQGWYLKLTILAPGGKTTNVLYEVCYRRRNENFTVFNHSNFNVSCKMLKCPVIIYIVYDGY